MDRPRYRLRAFLTAGWATRVLGSWIIVVALMAAAVNGFMHL